MFILPCLLFKAGHAANDLKVPVKRPQSCLGWIKWFLTFLQTIIKSILTLCFSGFFSLIQSFQLQSSKMKYNGMQGRGMTVWYGQNRSQSIFFQENLVVHILLQLTSLTLFIVYAFNILPPPSIALTGSPALRNFLFTASIGGPGLWVLSQAWLLLYFYLDNGSNVCGLEFNYKNEEEEGDSNDKEEDKEEEEKTGVILRYLGSIIFAKTTDKME